MGISEISLTVQSDKFYADMGIPMENAHAAISLGTEDGRRDTCKYLTHVTAQFDKINMFAKEKGLLNTIIKMLEEGAEVTKDTPMPGVKYDHATELENANCGYPGASKEATKKMKDALKTGSEGPFEFKETTDLQEVTVSVRVPLDTKKEDISVQFGKTTLRVAVRGHAMQPHVIDGTLTGAIDLDSAGWHLDVSADGRKLVLDMEKTMGGIT